MSINVYLESSIVNDLNYSCKRVEDPVLSFLGDVKLHRHNGEWLFYLTRLEDRIPDVLKEYVRLVTCVETFHSTWRNPGIYTYAGTVLRLEHKGNGMYEAYIEGATLDNIRNLYGLMRLGVIQPIKDWDAVQVKPDTAEIAPE